jgi:enhancing lycopene biosynthesis protein 2
VAACIHRLGLNVSPATINRVLTFGASHRTGSQDRPGQRQRIEEAQVKVDPVCYDTAKKFLRHPKGALAEDVQELAEAIQKLCEEYAGAIAADKAGEEI